MSEVDNYSKRGIHSIFIAIGSNIFPEENILKAVTNLKILFPSMNHSSVWQSPPAYGKGGDFLNVVAEIFSSFSATELKTEVFLPLEAKMGRIRTEDKNAPRIIDIDVIIYNSQIVDSEVSTMPHLSVPLAEINPDFPIDKYQTIENIAKIFTGDERIFLRKEILSNNL